MLHLGCGWRESIFVVVGDGAAVQEVCLLLVVLGGGGRGGSSSSEMHHAATSHESLSAAWNSSERSNHISTSLMILMLHSVLARCRLGVILKTLLLTCLSGVGMICSCSQTPHALVEIIESSCGVVGFPEALLLEYFVPEMLVGSVDASSVESRLVAPKLAIEHAESLSFSSLCHLRLVHLVRQHEVGVLLEREVDVVAQVYARQVVHDHWLRSELAQEEELVLTALPQELLLYLHVEVGLDGAHEEGGVLRGRCDYFLENLLALDEVDLAVSEEGLLHLEAQVGDGVDDWEDLESREEQAYQCLVENVLLLGELSTEECVRKEDEVVLEVLLVGADEMVELAHALLQVREVSLG